MPQKVRKSPEEIKRKYNAAYRLRQEVGEKSLPVRSRIIYAKAEDDFTQLTETRILISEFGFIIKQELIS